MAAGGALRRLKVRAALASARVPGVVARGLRAVLGGLWLGLLSDEDLRALDERYYASTDLYRTDAWNAQGLFGWERELVDRHLGDRRRVLVCAAGGGREVLALLEAGFDARGEEPHPALVAYAEDFLARRGHPGRIAAAPRGGFGAAGAADAAADALVVGWGALSLVHGHAARHAFLAAARERLSPGAPVLLSFFLVEQVGRELRWTRRLAGALRRLRGRRAPEPGDVLAPNLVHVFTRDELQRDLAAAGFDLIELRIVGEADGATRYAAAVARARA